MDCDLYDIRVQRIMCCELENSLRRLVIDAINGGLQPDLAMKAVEGVYEQERQCEATRRILERAYA